MISSATAEQQPPNTIFVGDLHIHCSETELTDLFSTYGEVSIVKIMRSQETGRNLSYGFISFVEKFGAQLAIDNLNGYMLRGRTIR
jgi:nucleolysin TIA-1/TIAR